EYIAQRNRRPGGPAEPGQISVAEALTIYATEHVPTVRDPARLAFAIERLLDFWGELPVSTITRETCRAYARSRIKVTRKDPDTGEAIETAPIADGTIRKELGTLSAALNYCREEGRLLNPPKVHMPDKPEPKDRWLTRSEAARLIWAAYRNPEARHLARFILIALYTGTRKTAILRLRFMRNVNGGYVDTAAGILYRRAPGQIETKKKTPHVRIAPRLLAHLRRWEAMGERWAVAYEGQGVASIKTAWGTAIKAAKLEDVTPHTLRHTAITWACQSGRADLWELSGYFGVSMETMTNVYAHHHPDHQQGAVAAVGGRKL
ncbi:site-specific integrase, partial [Cribrihabitans sp. XS_ASV171]